VLLLLNILIFWVKIMLHSGLLLSVFQRLRVLALLNFLPTISLENLVIVKKALRVLLSQLLTVKTCCRDRFEKLIRVGGDKFVVRQILFLHAGDVL
jgi:hypothetical protein